MSPWFEHRLVALGVQLLLLNGVGVMWAQGADGLEHGKAQVPPELRRLEVLVADWTGTNRVASTPTSPARNDPFVAQFRWLLDGFHLEGILRYAREDRPTQIRITWSFDYDAREYVVQWIDDAWSQATFFRGKPTSNGTILLRTERLVDGATVHETLNFKISKDAWIWKARVTFRNPGRSIQRSRRFQNPSPPPVNSDSPSPISMPNHVVQTGDCLSSIAAQQGLTWQQLWDHSNNADLRQQRQDPNILHPGDVVFVPDREERRHDGSTTRRHRFNRSDIPARLRIRLLRGGSAIKQAAYELFIDDQRVQAGQTDDEGRVEARISPAARAGVLRLTEARREFHLELGALDPVNETSGIQARLYNLGFDPGPIDGIIGPLTRAAVRSFQETYSLEVDGIPGPITQGKLQELHGC